VKEICGPEGQTHPCKFTLESKHLEGPRAFWQVEPHACGNVERCDVSWMTGGGFGDEKGSVTYSVGEGQQKETVVLSFENPWSGSNKYSVSGIAEQTPCKARQGHIADFEYNLRGK
jgi:hypothetical protein